MKKYRLKREAMSFFSEKYHNKIAYLHEWADHSVIENALEEVEPVYLTYGIKTSDTGSTLSGWSNGDKSDFCFTVNFPCIDYRQHKELDKLMKDVMYDMQQLITEKTKDFLESYQNNK